MTRQFVHHRFGAAPRGAAAFDPTVSDTPVRVMLIALRHDHEPPVFYGRQLLQRLQALLATTADQATADQVTFKAQPLVETAQPPTTSRFLPPLIKPSSNQSSVKEAAAMNEAAARTSQLARLVRGQLLSDNAGQLYERTGAQIRPLQHVVSGPRGEIIELVLAAPAHADASAEPPETEALSQAKSDSFACASAAQSMPHTVPARPFPTTTMRPMPGRPMRASGFANVAPSPVPPPAAVPLPPPPPQAVASATNATETLKTTIPTQWMNPWEFRLSRDEALYDMRDEAAARHSMLGSVRKLTQRVTSRQAWQKWQSLLCGKSAEEQLWSVRPPTGQFHHPRVRDWAQQTLAQAGYDANAMLPEWEIFWRRKGQ
ncbi:MAG: hypothetical protein HOP19_16540 [Acidobacteria bacterium]|nr:hypothetical protein [Acidobacteriota bacterium]